MRRLRSVIAALTVTIASVFVVTTGTIAPAHADECYSWTRTLRQGASGADVAQLQVRVAGWAGYGVNMGIDGQFGPQTHNAVRNFQAAHGLAADGVAGTNTYNKIYALQDADCSTLHFNWSEVDGGCGQGGYSGGSVDAATVKENLKRSMWRAEALRQKLGNRPLTVSSGFRSQACDRQVGGSGTGQHTYGRALDFTGTPTFCQLAQKGRDVGYGTILGPGYPGHNDHTHLDIRSGRFWDAPNCGI